MRLFISYARVDQRYCTQIVETLDVHEVWYDQRLYMGEDWWEEIVLRIKSCDAFLYLLSPESVSSEYCQRELQLALDENRTIFPVLIQPRTPIPAAIHHIQFIDLSSGLTAATVKELLNAIHKVDLKQHHSPPKEALAELTVGDAKRKRSKRQTPRPEALIYDAAYAMEQQNYDQAVYLFKQAKALQPRFKSFEVDHLLKEAEEKLDQQTYLRDAQREYEAILALVEHSSTRQFGLHAFSSFREQFPDYDPQNLSLYCEPDFVPILKWCPVDEGEVAVKVGKRKIVFFVNEFQISKYPITNAKFQLFLDAEDGYHDPRWWEFSSAAKLWHQENPEPMDTHLEWGDHPRTNVNWYEAMAFCNWMSFKTKLNITLPKEEFWQRSAQGNDDRIYPWGNEFDANCCNTQESEIGKTSHITRFITGASPYGVVDLVGNVWEWCDINHYSGKPEPDFPDGKRVIRGGSYTKNAKNARATSRRQIEPEKRNVTLGFRVMIQL